MRIFVFCVLSTLGIAQISAAATISVALKPNISDGAGGFTPGEASFNTNPSTFFGSVVGVASGPTGVPPINGGVHALIPTIAHRLDSNTTAAIRSDARRSEVGLETQIYLTTYSYFTLDTPTATGDSYKVVNSAYWEFQINGIYNWRIEDQAPQFTGAKRTFSFSKVGGSVLASDSLGNGGTNPSGTLDSGTYRLLYTHTNDNPFGTLANPALNPLGSTNLNAFFTFVSEDPNVVPEPTSLAVFGLLGIGSAVAKLRRRK